MSNTEKQNTCLLCKGSGCYGPEQGDMCPNCKGTGEAKVMSNPDGEDTQRCKFNCDGPKSELDQFCGCWNELHQELASLREQLAQCEKVKEEKHKRYDELFASLSTRNDELNTTRKQLKQKEDENRELLTVLKSIESKYTPFNKRVHDDDIYAITEVLRKNLSA